MILEKMILRSQKGFTLLEMLVVITMLGILAAFAAPGWLRFVEGQRLTTARDALYTSLRNTQTQAQAKGTTWQFSVREHSQGIEWASHPKSVVPDEAVWESLDSSSFQIDAETTFAASANVYYVRFDERGNVQYRLGRITLSSKDDPEIKRCVIVSTIIGAMRKSKEKPTPRDGKFCY